MNKTLVDPNPTEHKLGEPAFTVPATQLVPKRVVVFALLALLFIVLVAAQLVLLKALPYTTSQVQYVSSVEALNKPTPNFAIGSFDWSVDSFAKDPRLGVFRRYFLDHCQVSSGLASANCAVAALAHDITFGNTQSDFLSTSYNPSLDFQSELAGKTGFCTNFSTFLVSSLVAVGIPARVVQFVPDTLDGNGGHTIIEVWDQAHGWVLIDPSTGVQPTCDGQACSALNLTQHPESVGWISIESPRGGEDPARKYSPTSLFFKGMDIVYPEPWSYLRFGEHKATFPYVTSFNFIGVTRLQFGFAQTLLRWGIVISGILTLLSLALAVGSLKGSLSLSLLFHPIERTGA